MCTGSQPILCRAKDQCHEAGVCDPETGLCSNRSKPAKPDGTACDDGNACTEADTCLAGVCTGTNPVECPPSDQCHEAGVCDPAIGLCSNPLKADGATCDDEWLGRFERRIRDVASRAVAHIKRGDGVTIRTTAGARVRADAAVGADPVLRFLALLEPTRVATPTPPADGGSRPPVVEASPKRGSAPAAVSLRGSS